MSISYEEMYTKEGMEEDKELLLPMIRDGVPIRIQKEELGRTANYIAKIRAELIQER